MTEEAKLIVDTLRYCEESGARCGGCPSGHDENGIPNCHSQSHIADLIESLSTQLDQVTRERNAAVEDLNYVSRIDGSFCSICKHQPQEECEKRKFEHMDCFEWRGVEVEG